MTDGGADTAGYTDDVAEMLRRSAMDYLSERPPRRAELGVVPAFDAQAWAGFAELGWLGLGLPESLGGSGLGLSEATVLCEQFGRTPCNIDYLAASLLPSLLMARMSPSAELDELGAALLAGRRPLAVAWQEQPGQSDTEHPRTQMLNGQLTGRKVFVPALSLSSMLLVTVDHGGRAALVAVAADAHGVTLQTAAAGLGSASTVLFDQAPVLMELADGTEVIAALQRGLAAARIALCSYLTGIAGGVLDKTLAYVGGRVQFHKPIAAFQSVRHRCVDLAIATRLANASWHHALQCFESAPDAPDTVAAIGAAKARCGDVAVQAAREAVQLHGAMGFTEEGGVGQYLRAALQGRAWLGGPMEHRRRFMAARAETATLWAERSSGRSADVLVAQEAGVTPGNLHLLSDEDFRVRWRTWLATHYPPEYRQDARRPFRRLRGEDHLRWIRLLQRDSWRAPSWPREIGGLGLSFRKLLIYQQELERIGAARVIDNGEIQIGPTLIHCGSEAQRREYLPKILSGEHVWAQGYSEPGAGSDLASLRTGAVPGCDERGAHFIVNGQKTWTTHAQECTHMYALVRTGAPGQYPKKQQGISFLLIDLKTPGITVRPILTIAGESELCEVFFDDVRVPAENLLGKLDHGWDVAKSLLGHERVWLGSPAMAAQALTVAEQVVFETGQQHDAGVTDRLAQLTADLYDYRLLYAELCDHIAVQETPPGPDVSMLKVYVSELQQRITEFTAEVAGEYGGIVGETQIGALLVDLHWPLMMARPVTIFAGCNEVQRDILAKAVLRLPETTN